MIEKEYVENLTARLPEIESMLSDPAVAANQNKFRKLVKEHSVLKKLSNKGSRYFDLCAEVNEYSEMIKDESLDGELRELAKAEIGDLEKSRDQAEADLMIALVPSDPNDERNAIVEIRAGTGGNEAALFAGDLFRMYSHHAEARGWKTCIVDASVSDVGGYKEVVFSVEGNGVYGDLRYEMGVHRVQRVPLTESSGRIHTSAATVAVFPEVEADDNIKIDPDELRVDIYCASGPGGQGVNTTYSAVRITHLPTGLVAQSQDERSQHRNKEQAMTVLMARIVDQRRREEDEKKGDARRSQIGSGDRSERIRTYNFPQNRLTDHRIDLTMYSLDRFVEGDIAAATSALRDHDIKLKLDDILKKREPKEAT
ncbi:MAG: peptide chain release factor 1 [Kiritimatiellae bacterium]|nr:peptide chain release factor 1 [Kiritimatiellia bacterium]